MRKFNITVNGKSYEVDVEEIGGTQSVAAPVQKAAAPKAAAPAPKAVGNGQKITAPMPGTVNAIKVKTGDSVKKDDVVAILEAMKMENEIFAGVDGTVTSVVVSVGDSVNSGDVIITIG